MAEAVIPGPRLRVGEHRIGLADLLETCLGACVTGVRIGVVLTGLLPVRTLEVALAGVAAHTEQLVVVGRHRWQFYCWIGCEMPAGACAPSPSPSPSEADSRRLTVCTAASAFE